MQPFVLLYSSQALLAPALYQPIGSRALKFFPVNRKDPLASAKFTVMSRTSGSCEILRYIHVGMAESLCTAMVSVAVPLGPCQCHVGRQVWHGQIYSVQLAALWRVGSRARVLYFPRQCPRDDRVHTAVIWQPSRNWYTWCSWHTWPHSWLIWQDRQRGQVSGFTQRAHHPLLLLQRPLGTYTKLYSLQDPVQAAEQDPVHQDLLVSGSQPQVSRFSGREQKIDMKNAKTSSKKTCAKESWVTVL